MNLNDVNEIMGELGQLQRIKSHDFRDCDESNLLDGNFDDLQNISINNLFMKGDELNIDFNLNVEVPDYLKDDNSRILDRSVNIHQPIAGSAPAGGGLLNSINEISKLAANTANKASAAYSGFDISLREESDGDASGDDDHDYEEEDDEAEDYKQDDPEEEGDADDPDESDDDEQRFKMLHAKT